MNTKKRTFGHRKQILSFVLALILLSLLLFFIRANRKENETITKSAFKLDTYISVTLYGTNDSTLIDQAFALCDSYENLFSTTIPQSDIYQFNHKEDRNIPIHPDTEELIQYGLNYGKLTNGSFDITIGNLSSLWDFKADQPTPPDDSLIHKALPHVDYRKISIKNHTLSSSDKEIKLDLGGIAKGFIADKMKEFLVNKGVKRGTINLGGNVLCIGSKTGNKPFVIGIQKPFANQGEVLIALSVKDYSVVTSGTYERYFRYDDTLYHHILNPKTGYPYESKLSSVTILSKKSVDGDGLSTSCFALGLDKAMELINHLDDTYAIFITTDNKIYYSEGCEDKFLTK